MALQPIFGSECCFLGDEEKPYFDGFVWTDYAFWKLEEIFTLLRWNSAALFFDIATQTFGGFGSENDSFLGMKKSLEGPWKRERKPLQFTISRGTIPQTWTRKRALLNRLRQLCRAWSRRALWPHVWPQTALEHSETVELRATKSEGNVAKIVKNH